MYMYLQNEKSTEYVEGEIYEIVEIEGHRFEIVCGYNGKQEKKAGVVLPRYPNFKKTPKYTKDGYRLTTCMQEACKFYKPMPDRDREKECGDCIHFKNENRNVIGICKCENLKKNL